MWTLVRKDLILDRRLVGLNVVMYVIMGPVFMGLLSEAPVKIVAVWAGIVGAMIPLSLVAREDKFKTPALTCSLPVTRNTIVAARFVGGWGLAVAGALAILASCYLTAATGLAHPQGGWPDALLAGFVTIGLLLAGLNPFTMRFGFAGLMVFLVFTQVLGIVAFVTLALFGGHGALRSMGGWIAGTVGSLHEALGPPGYDLVLVTLVVALNLASFAFSRWIYRRREF